MKNKNVQMLEIGIFGKFNWGYSGVIWYFDPRFDFSSLYFEPPHGKL